MDENDKILKGYFSSKSNYNVPYSFTEKVIAGIESEKRRRAKIIDNLQIISVFIVAAALLVLSFNYLNVNYFKISIDEINLTGESEFVKNSIFRVKTLLLDKSTVKWYIIAFNTALLIVLQQLLQSKYLSKKFKD